MHKPLVVTNTVAIEAPAFRVWDALINPEKTRIYMFGCEAVTDWKVGSPLLWRGTFDGEDVIFVKGAVVEIEQEKFLTYTVFDPNSTLEDVPENYLTVTYELSFGNGQTLLTVTQGDFALVAQGERRYNEVFSGGEGWSPILREIKELAESQEVGEYANFFR